MASQLVSSASVMNAEALGVGLFEEFCHTIAGGSLLHLPELPLIECFEYTLDRANGVEQISVQGSAMLYYSEANFHKRVAPDTLEDVDIKQPRSYNPEAFLPEEVRNAIYNDRRWFDRSKYLPEGSDEDPFMYLDTQIYDALHALTELQREILFRTIINGESTESVAQDKQCSSRNIRDIRARALRQIRAKIKRREGYGRPDVVIIILLFMLLVGVPLACWGEQLWAAYPWLESVAAVLSALVMAVMFQNSLRREAERLLRQHWASLNGSQKKE